MPLSIGTIPMPGIAMVEPSTSGLWDIKLMPVGRVTVPYGGGSEVEPLSLVFLPPMPRLPYPRPSVARLEWIGLANNSRAPVTARAAVAWSDMPAIGIKQPWDYNVLAEVDMSQCECEQADASQYSEIRPDAGVHIYIFMFDKQESYDYVSMEAVVEPRSSSVYTEPHGVVEMPDHVWFAIAMTAPLDINPCGRDVATPVVRFSGTTSRVVMYKCRCDNAIGEYDPDNIICGNMIAYDANDKPVSIAYAAYGFLVMKGQVSVGGG